ncbi:hypothetical protein EYF80_034294 [Liparis tanakae]|uniref:Uncharacterized protein n=1 Tax=Liparis tanakae TaxID=230148 RepID=A0A4Z2GRY5_9TELE|nr:hypothetical protein EYF80_034294 [Liparis tanakae]
MEGSRVGRLATNTSRAGTLFFSSYPAGLLLSTGSKFIPGNVTRYACEADDELDVNPRLWWQSANCTAVKQQFQPSTCSVAFCCELAHVQRTLPSPVCYRCSNRAQGFQAGNAARLGGRLFSNLTDTSETQCTALLISSFAVLIIAVRRTNTCRGKRFGWYLKRCGPTSEELAEAQCEPGDLADPSPPVPGGGGGV